MSNNHPNDNIYSILGKLEALKPTAEEKHQSLIKEIRHSVEAKGSITEGVNSVETTLTEKYMGFKKLEKSIAAKGDVRDPAAVAASIGRKKYGQKAMTAKAVAGKKKANEETTDEVAPPGAKAERMVKGIKKSLSKDGHLSGKDKAIAYATTWKAHNKGQVEEAYNPVKAVKQCASDYMEMNGISSVHDLEAEDIEYIGGECQMNYQDVCKILGCELPDSLGPVKSYDEHGDLEEGCTCNEGACAMHEAEITRTAGKTVHRKTEFPGYPADDADDLDNLRGPGAGKRGRPRKHAAKVATGLGRGRPTKAKAPTFSKQADPFGRVSGAVPKGKKGTVHSMAEAMTTLEKSLRRINEGVNFAELLKEKHQTVDEMLAQLGDDIKLFKDTGHCSELLRDCMEIKGYHGKMVADEASQGGIGHDLVSPAQRVAQATPPKPGIMGAVKDVAQGAKNWIQGKPETGATYEEADSMKAELDELAKLAGLQTSEGNAFTGKLASTPKGGSFELDGKTFKDTSTLDEEPNEGNAFSGAVARAKADGVQPGEKITVGGKEYPVKEAEVAVDEPNDDDLENDPDEKYGTIKQITSQGDDMNRQKRQDPHTANRAANPFTNDKMTLEAKLAAEYESIKKVSK